MQILQLSPVRSPRKKTKKAGVLGKLREPVNLRRLAGQLHVSPEVVKNSIVVFFTICWLAIALVRSNTPGDPATSEGTTLIGLAATMQQGAISGRDFQSAYGPAAQLLAWMATGFVATRSAFDAWGMITLFFCVASAVVAGAMLLLADRFSWQQTAIFYAFAIPLNLFFQPRDLQTVLLLLNGVFAYRIVTSDTASRQTLWAAATGLLCFVSQLVTFELGMYSSVVVVLTLIAGTILTRTTAVLHGIGVFVATFAAANLGLSVFFKLTSSRYTLLFDYQSYALEILRGNHNSMGVLWSLSLVQTAVLAIAAAYVLGICVVSAIRSDASDASLLAAFTISAMAWLKTAFVRSDVHQIVFAFTPVVVTVGMLATLEWKTLRRRVAWAVVASGLVVAWPSLNTSAPVDLWRIASGEVPARKVMNRLRMERTPVDAKNFQTNPAGSSPAERQEVPLLAFPAGSYVVAGLRRPLFAPVMESHEASSTPLERYYIEALDRQRQAGIEILYAPDRGELPPTDHVEAIARTPLIFEYLYRHFELGSHADGDKADEHYLLRVADRPREVVATPLEFSVLQRTADSAVGKLANPSVCGLVRLKIRIDYARTLQVFRPSGIVLTLSHGEKPVWRGSIRPLEPNQAFTAYVSPLPAGALHRVFGRDPIHGVAWDTFEYHKADADLLGVTASRVDIASLDCLDAGRFAVPL